jgi:hypothetical protein
LLLSVSTPLISTLAFTRFHQLQCSSSALTTIKLVASYGQLLCSVLTTLPAPWSLPASPLYMRPLLSYGSSLAIAHSRMAPLLYIGDTKEHSNSGRGYGKGRADAAQACRRPSELQRCRELSKRDLARCSRPLDQPVTQRTFRALPVLGWRSSPAQSRTRLGHLNLSVSFYTLSRLRGLHIYRLYSRRSAPRHCLSER